IFLYIREEHRCARAFTQQIPRRKAPLALRPAERPSSGRSGARGGGEARPIPFLRLQLNRYRRSKSSWAGKSPRNTLVSFQSIAWRRARMRLGIPIFSGRRHWRGEGQRILTRYLIEVRVRSRPMATKAGLGISAANPPQGKHCLEGLAPEGR